MALTLLGGYDTISFNQWRGRSGGDACLRRASAPKYRLRVTNSGELIR